MNIASDLLKTKLRNPCESSFAWYDLCHREMEKLEGQDEVSSCAK